MSTFEKVYLKRNIRVADGSYILTGTSYKVEMESDKDVCIRLPNGKGKWVEKENCMIDATALGPFRGASLTT